MSFIEKTAVIGHGPSIKGCGEQINEYKYVIRIPRRPFWLMYPEDFGCRVTHWCGNRATWKHNVHLVQVPECGYYVWDKKQPEMKLNIIAMFPEVENKSYTDISKIIRYWQNRMIKPTIHPHFCNGMGAILAAVTQIGLPVDVFGCDNLRDGNNNIKQYSGSDFYDHKAIISGRTEDFKKERFLIPKISKEYDVRIEFHG